MFKYFTLSLSLIISSGAFAQTKAITDSGEEVILNEDGTWKYANIQKAYDTRLDTQKFNKDPKATFLVKSKIAKKGVWIDPKKWKFSPNNSSNPSVEYLFNMKNNSEVMAMNVSERIGMSYAAFKGIFINHIKETGTNVQIVREEPRIINGMFVHLIEIESTIKGIHFHYMGYFYANEDETVQLIAFTGNKLFPLYKDEIESFLNGFTVVQD